MSGRGGDPRPRRRVRLVGDPLHWIKGEPVASDIVCILHVLLPEGERWFCKVFNEALPYVKDEDLARAMRGFIGQEAIHAEAHDKAVTEFLEARGVDTGPALRQFSTCSGGCWRRAVSALPAPDTTTWCNGCG